MMGIPVQKPSKNFNDVILTEILTTAITMTCWLAPALRRKLKHKVLQSYLHLLHSMILVLFILTPFTMPSCISLFNAFRITQTRMMVLMITHGFRSNAKLKAQFWKDVPTCHIFGVPPWNISCPLQPLHEGLPSAQCGLHSLCPHCQHATQALRGIRHAQFDGS